MTDTAITLDEVREHAARAWRTFTETRNLHATLAWDSESVTPDGSRLVSARIAGRGAAHALYRFTADYHVILGAPGDQRPQFDYTDPARTACVWRKSGVWVELWVPANAGTPGVTAVSTPVGAVAEPSLSESVVAALRGLGGRLPYTRNRRPKETTTA